MRDLRVKTLIVVAALALGLGTLACNAIEARPQAESIAEAMFEARRTRGSEAALVHYHPSFFESTGRRQWVAMLDDAEANLGALQSHTLQESEVVEETEGVDFPVGTYVTLAFETRYARATATEKVTVLFAPGQEPGIVNHRMTPQHP